MAGAIKGVGFLVVLGILFLLLASATAPITADLAREAGQSIVVENNNEPTYKTVTLRFDQDWIGYYYDQSDLAALSASSDKDHNPHESIAAKERIQSIWDQAQIKIGQNPEQTSAVIYCAVVAYQNGSTYVRLLLVAAEGETSGTMAWYGSDGWVHAFDGKDLQGFLTGNPRGALSYNTGMNLVDCINTIKGGLPAPNKIAP